MLNGILASIALAGLIMCGIGVSAAEKPVKGYITDLPPESAKDREARHARISERRKGPVVIVHRGASSFAPENTLEAYAAAMDYGADGCEIDIRRTADGVLVLFHDDMLENLTNGFGAVSQLTYYELLCLERRSVYGTAARETPIPTFASLLALARQRAMLLHLDVKEPGLEADIARLLDEADIWDAVVSINTNNADSLRASPKVGQLSYKAPGLFEDRTDADLDAVKAALAKPGDMIIVDDPRVAANVLARPAYAPVPLPKNLRKDWQPSHPEASTELIPQRYIASLAGSDPVKLLDCSEAGRSDVDGDAAQLRAHREKILARAWAAQQVGEAGQKTPQMVELLEYQVKHRSLDRDWRYHGMDGTMAVYALASLDAVESVPLLAGILMSVDPALEEAKGPEFANTIPPYQDWRIKQAIIHAFGDLRCDTSKAALTAFLALDEVSMKKLGVYRYELATRSLLKHKLSVEEIRELLRNPEPRVRGTAILECIDHPNKERSEALKSVPWALDLPRAR